MSLKDIFNPVNAPDAETYGEFIMTTLLGKSAHKIAANNHGSLLAHNRIVYPNVVRPWVCPLLNSLVAMVQLEDQLPVSSNLHFQLTDRFLDSICVHRKRATKILKKSTTDENGKKKVQKTRIANSSKVNSTWRESFRQDTHFPASDFITTGFLETDEERERKGFEKAETPSRRK